MKVTFLKNTVLAAALITGLSFTSCKEKHDENDMDNDTEVLEPMDADYGDDNDTLVTSTDTITEVNREDDDFEVHTQVP